MFFIETSINVMSSESTKTHFFLLHHIACQLLMTKVGKKKQPYSFQISYYLHVIRVKDNPVAQQEYHFAKSLLSQNVVCN